MTDMSPPATLPSEHSHTYEDCECSDGKGTCHKCGDPESTHTDHSQIILKPTWTGMLPMILHVYEHGDTIEARKTARDELYRLAAIVDNAIAAQHGKGQG